MNYFDILERIVRGAEYLEQSNLTKQEYDNGMKLYNDLVKQAQEMRNT